MKIEFKPSKITFDTVGFSNEVSVYVKAALDQTEEKYIELMRQGVDETVTAPKHWLEGIKDSIRHLETIIQGDIITYVTGVVSSPGSAAWLRAMVVAYGMGIYGLTGQRIYAGPEGKEVWDNDLSGRTRSAVKEEHEIPPTWYHAGSWFIQNATTMMSTLYTDTMELALAALPQGIVSKHIIVSAGG